MNNTKMKGSQTAIFGSPVYIYSYASIVGAKEGQGPLGSYFDIIEKDSMCGKDNWEGAESAMQSYAVNRVLKKSSLSASDIRYMFAGDLLSQLIATTFGIKDLSIPLFGIYGACSTMGEGLSLAAMTIDGGFSDYSLALTSSHFAGSEKQFRFPLDYGNQRPLAATWTVTGSAAIILSKNPPDYSVISEEICIRNNSQINESDIYQIVVESITTGTIVDYGIKDSMNMGACMAPAAAEVIYKNLTDLRIAPDYYDKIITGDLGMVGKDILLDILEGKGYDIKNLHMDCGIEIYYNDIQDTHSGGSGCGCSAVTLAGFILGKLRTGEWKNVLFVPTGALLSPTSYNEGSSVPGIAHALHLKATK